MRSPVKVSLIPFLLFLLFFYCVYPFLASTAGGVAHVFRNHWPIAVVMTLGSYFAGSTPVGGGSVAFPILVLLFDQPASLGREFSLAIQSLGMTAASLYLLGLGRRIEWEFLRSALIGSMIGTPFGCMVLVPLAPNWVVKIAFACLWCAFGLFALLRMKRRDPTPREGAGLIEPSARQEVVPSVLAGFLGGLVASLIGGGADMLAFSYLVFRRRLDPRIAIPTAMMLMAATSLVALATIMLSSLLQEGVWDNWLAAAPIVVIGAPLGAFAVSLIPRRVTMSLVAVLCIAQFVWMCYDKSLSAGTIGLSCCVVIVLVGVLYLLDQQWRGASSEVVP